MYDETGDENTITSSAMKRKEFVVRNSLLERDEWSSILKTRTEIGLLERMIDELTEKGAPQKLNIQIRKQSKFR